MVDHLFRLVSKEVTSKEQDVHDTFPDEALLVVHEYCWDVANCKAVMVIPEGMNWQQKKRFF